jgi:hypothetical protein
MDSNKAFKSYTVTIRKPVEAWDEARGITYTHVRATSKREAIESTRRKATNDGHIGYGQGRYTISAEEVETCDCGCGSSQQHQEY